MCYLSPRTFCYPSPKSKHPPLRHGGGNRSWYTETRSLVLRNRNLLSDVGNTNSRISAAQVEEEKDLLETKGLPVADAADVGVHEVGGRIVTDAAAAHRERHPMQLIERASGHAPVERQSVHVQAMMRNAVAARRQHRVGLGRTIAGDNRH